MIRPREIGDGVAGFAALTPTLPPATHTNSYALGGRELLLVEPATPYEDEQREWLDWARSLASAGREIVGVLLTHHHPDHVGGAEVLGRELGVPLWGHAATAGLLPTLRIERQIDDGDDIVLDGPTPQRWQVLHTPGHASGHVCLYEKEHGWVVVGDMVASVGTIVVAPGDGHMRTYLEQLERLEGLGARVALPAHGDPIEEPARLFRHYIEHRGMREAKVKAALDQVGAKGGTAEELLPVVYEDTPQAAWPIALLSIRAHLEKLVEDGDARLAEDRYTAASA